MKKYTANAICLNDYMQPFFRKLTGSQHLILDVCAKLS